MVWPGQARRVAWQDRLWLGQRAPVRARIGLALEDPRPAKAPPEPMQAVYPGRWSRSSSVVWT